MTVIDELTPEWVAAKSLWQTVLDRGPQPFAWDWARDEYGVETDEKFRLLVRRAAAFWCLDPHPDGSTARIQDPEERLVDAVCSYHVSLGHYEQARVMVEQFKREDVKNRGHYEQSWVPYYDRLTIACRLLEYLEALP